MDPKSSGKIGLYSISYYLSTSVLAAIMGIFLVIFIQPGNPQLLEKTDRGDTKDLGITTQDAALDLIRNMFPENLARAFTQQGFTYYTYDNQIVNTTSN